MATPHSGHEGPTALNLGSRAASWRSLTEHPLDVLVIGGGIVGAGTALDAASRGLRVGLVEARDLGSGTSSRSSKLVHGGLRYLEMLQFSLVAEALDERGRLLDTLAPHLVRDVPFLYPLRHRGWERPYVGAGIWLYDQLAAHAHRRRGAGTRLPRHRHLTRSSALTLAPALRPESLVGAIQYYDAQVDDARLVSTLARTAAGHGAAVLTRSPVRRLRFDPSGRVIGAVVTDNRSGADHEITARHTVLAAGVWTPQLLAATPADGAVRVHASKGVHLLVPRDRLRSETGIILRTATSVLFVIPWGTHWLIGTTDTAHRGSLSHPVGTREDVDYLLGQVNSVFTDQLTDEDVVAVYAGLRPLVELGTADDVTTRGTARMSREHVVAAAAPGLSVVAGGKLTTYRVMAADAVDAATVDLTGSTNDGPLSTPASNTDRLPLLGADGYHELADDLAVTAARWGVTPPTANRLLHRYGTATDQVLAPAAGHPELLTEVPGTNGYLAAEFLYAASHEGALHLTDVLMRRTRVAVETPDGGVAAAQQVARIISAELGWDDDDVARQVAAYDRRIRTERLGQPDSTARPLGQPVTATTPT